MLRLLASTLIICCVGAASAEGKALKAIWGPLDLPNGKSAGPVYKKLGVDVLQVGVRWSDIAVSRPAAPRDPADPAYSWDPTIDRAIKMGRYYGFSVALLVVGTPPWANGGQDDRWVPDKPKDYGDFVYAASKRWPDIRRWMIWGEPGRLDRFMPNARNDPRGPRAYAKLLDAAYAGLHAASRRNLVIGAMTFTAGDVVPRDFVKWMKLPNGKPPRLDMWGHNPFSTRRPDMRQTPYADGNYDFSDMDTLYRQVWHTYRKAYKRWRKRGPRIWVSEYTIQAEHGSNDFNYYVSLQDQGEWIWRAFLEANKHPYIDDVGWLGLLDEPLAPYNRTTGLLTYNLERKPAYVQFKRAP